jgi:ABC-2 type transport system ATP-binding protein
LSAVRRHGYIYARRLVGLRSRASERPVGGLLELNSSLSDFEAEERGDLTTLSEGISVRRTTKSFGPLAALRDVSFDVAPREVAVLLGPNGSGKSTLLRILGTTVIADAGEIRIAGHDVLLEAAAVRRSIGFLLADERSWYWRLTGRHNLEFFAALYGLTSKERKTRTTELLQEVGLVEAADRPFGAYSSGMRLRLSLARALLPAPPVLLLDEPTRSLDPLATKQFRDLIRQLAEQRQTAVLMATHDLHEAAAIASRVLVLLEGQLRGIVEGPCDSTELERMLLGGRG